MYSRLPSEREREKRFQIETLDRITAYNIIKWRYLIYINHNF